MRRSKFVPDPHLKLDTVEIPEIDLDDKKIKTAANARFANAEIAQFNFIPELALKDIHIPILTPLVAEDVPGSPAEPIYDTRAQGDIQGNIIPGFNKDHQHFLFLRFDKRVSAKKFLREILPWISSMEEVLAFRRLYRSKRMLLGRHKTFLCSTWVNIGFSHRALGLLTSKEEADRFGDGSFKLGLKERATYLGDSHKSIADWKVGGPKNEADIVVIVASDHGAVLEDLVAAIKDLANATDIELLFEQRGDTLPGDLRGHEHFGFKDGISQPGVRGKLSATPGDYITPRYIAATDDRRLYNGKPGQALIWPGQILLGEVRQDPNDFVNSAPAASNFPKWAERGSYLVVRRLNQNVPEFYEFVTRGAAATGIPADKFAAMLVGRWPSGAPILRTPGGDDPALGDDDFANNHFIFDDNTRPSNLRPIPGYPGDSYPPAMADFLAQVCPHFAHIRKINPRDTATDLGKPADGFMRMILRRGIPFGRPIVGIKEPDKKLIAEERGLMFLCYNASIEDQFEFLQRRWSNSATQPNMGGFDPIIGQSGRSTGGRSRFIEMPTPAGPRRLKIQR